MYSIVQENKILINLLKAVKEFFNEKGNIYTNNNSNISRYMVLDLNTLNIIIPHFIKYSLITTKKDGFKIFPCLFINDKKHLNKSGKIELLNLV